MEQMEYFPDGTVLPTREYAQTFVNDLRETIVAQLFGRKERVEGRVDEEGDTLSCTLPRGQQLLDFVTLEATGNDNEFEVTLLIPSREDEDRSLVAGFIYSPPA